MMGHRSALGPDPALVAALAQSTQRHQVARTALVGWSQPTKNPFEPASNFSKGFCVRDKFLERGQRIFDFATANAVDGQLGAEVKQLHPDGWYAVRPVRRKPKHSDLVTSGSGHRNHACFLRSHQKFDVGLGDAQSAKRFVECRAHRYTLDAVEIRDRASFRR